MQGPCRSARRVVAHLERHGVPARAEERRCAVIFGFRPARCRVRADLSADMIVAGAYHHSQLREVALTSGGGRDLLRHMTVPVLMSH